MATCWHAVHLAHLASRPRPATGYLGRMVTPPATTALVTLLGSRHALSLQYHERKEETISVQSGRLLLEVGEGNDGLESFELHPGESVHIRPGTRHRMVALVDTVLLEASTTELDDVVRLEDRYGR